MSTAPDDQDRDEARFARPARIRHLHAACTLLSQEQAADDQLSMAPGGVRWQPPPPPQGRQTVAAHGFVKAAIGVALLVAFVATVLSLWLSRSPIEPVADYRLGVHYDDAELTSAIVNPDRNELWLATLGSGIHTVDVRNGFLQQITHQSTNGQLLTDHVVRLAYGPDGRIFALCEQDGGRGLCSVDPSLTSWRTLLGVARFPELTAPGSPARITSVAGMDGLLWLGTDRAGIGVYNPATHAWQALHRAANSGLLDDHVRDLLADPSGGVWVATDAGINRYRDGQWERITDLAGKQVRRLRWNDGALWYVTAGGGLGRYDGSMWKTLASESRWEKYGDSDLALAGYDASRDQLWFVAKDGVVGRYDRQSRVWTGFDA